MNITDKYFRNTLLELKNSPNKDENPRAKYKDGTPAFTQFITQKTFTYDISEGEFPINTLRNTAIKGGWYDIESIYIKQTNIIEEMHPSIHGWWEDFVVDKTWFFKDEQGHILGITKDKKPNYSGYFKCKRSIGQTYGHTVKRYDLMNKLLKGLEVNPFGRRHIINLWQEQQMIEDPAALVPCAYETLWTVRDVVKEIYDEKLIRTLVDAQEDMYKYITSIQKTIRYVDLTLSQRSMDYLMVSSINPTQYVMFGMAVCGHLTQATGIKHELGIFTHHVQNLHVYDRHLWAIDELLNRDPKNEQPKIELLSNKNFYDYTIDDFKITIPAGIEKLSKQLELAI